MAIPVLAVDDEVNFLELLRRVLGKKGFEINTASNGRDALRLLDREVFDFVLLDIRMEPMNGLRLLEEIKKRQPRTRAIMVTAHPTEETRSLAYAKGAAAYLSKPVDIYDLLHAFTSALSH